MIRGKLIALHAAAKLEAKPANELPNRLIVAPWGSHETNKGTVVVNSTTLAQLPANNRAARFDRVALDFNHNTVPGAPAHKGEPAKVAAYGNVSVEDGIGIVLSAIEWTPEGREHASNGHYPDVSPAIVQNDAGEVIFLHSAGLARQGEMDGVTLFSADYSPSQPNEKRNMNYKALVITILSALGFSIPGDASDEDVKKAAEDFAEKNKKKPEAETPTALSAAIMEAIKPLSAEIEKLKQVQLAAQTNEEKGQRDQLIQRASQEGKVIPLSAELIATTPITVLSAMVEALPVTVPMEQRTGKVKELSAAGMTDTADRSVRETLGISEEVWKKHNAA